MPNPADTESMIRKRHGLNVETLSGNKTLSPGDDTMQRLDPGGSGRDINLPDASTNGGLAFLIANFADAAEDLTVKDSGGSTVVTVSQNEQAWVASGDGSWNHLGIVSISQS